MAGQALSFEAAKKIDRMADIGKAYDAKERRELQTYAFGVYSEALENKSTAPDYFANWDKRLRLNDKQIEYLIGENLRQAVGDAIYVIDRTNDSSVLKTPISMESTAR
jgi:hypothetical protein